MPTLPNPKVPIRPLLERLRTTSGAEGVGLFEDVRTVLLTALRFHPDIPRDARRLMILGCLNDLKGLNRLSEPALLEFLAIEESKYLSQPQVAFTFISTVSLGRPPQVVRIRHRLGTITIGSQPGRHLRQARKAAERPTSVPDDPWDYSPVVCKVLARSPHEAALRAFDLVDLVRGIWNYLINRQTYGRIISSGTIPINTVRMGPFHTLHLPNSEVAPDGLWYEPFFRASSPSPSLRSGWANLRSTEKKARGILRKHPYEADMSDLLIRYARTMDGADFETVFLKLWGLLETLTGTGGGRYDTTISRAVFLWDEPEVGRIILEHLRDHRNHLTHSGVADADVETLAFQLKRYVEALIGFHFGLGGFSSLGKAGEWLDLPYDTNVLKQRIKSLHSALRFRHRRL